MVHISLPDHMPVSQCLAHISVTCCTFQCLITTTLPHSCCTVQLQREDITCSANQLGCTGCTLHCSCCTAAAALCTAAAVLFASWAAWAWMHSLLLMCSFLYRTQCLLWVALGQTGGVGCSCLGAQHDQSICVQDQVDHQVVHVQETACS